MQIPGHMNDWESWVWAERESSDAQDGDVGDPHPGDHVRVRQVLRPDHGGVDHGDDDDGVREDNICAINNRCKYFDKY